jgi:hypothetical protein
MLACSMLSSEWWRSYLLHCHISHDTNPHWLRSSISTANAGSLYLLTSSQANAQQSPNYHAMNANTLILWQVLYSLISRTTWTQHRLYPFPNQERPTDFSIGDSTGNMKAETWLTNVSLSTCKLASSFVGSINADSLRFLIYKAQKVRHQMKIGCKTNYPYQSWTADQTLIGAAVSGAAASGPLWATCTDRHRRCQRNNHGEVGEMHCLCICWRAWMIYLRWRKMSRFYTIAKDNA